MDPDRRRLLILGGTTAAAAMAGPGGAAETVSSLTLDAQLIEPSGSPPRLSYHRESAPPVLRVPRGDIVRISLKNSLVEPTALTWHGLRGGNAADVSPGLTGTPLAPGATTSVEVRTPESGTFWFHPPFVPGWSDQTARGLGGVLIVEELVPPAVEDDAVLFLGDNALATGTALTERLSVNGKPWPETKTYAPGSRIRLRLVNASTRQALTASFEGARALVIAIDGQPSELFRPLNDTLPVGPGARFDVLVDLPRTADQAFRVALRGEDTASPAAAVFVAQVAGAVKAEHPAIVALEPNPLLPRIIPLENATRVELAVQGVAGGRAPGPLYALNGSSRIELPKAPLFTAKRDTAVTIGFANHSADLIGFRLHGQAMRLLHALDDGWEPYWRDSVLVPPGKTVRVAFVTGFTSRWMIDSPFFNQATTGLRHWFEVR